MKRAFDFALIKEPKRRKVFIDVGGHIGETLRRFQQQVSDASEYEIYTFEPDPDSFKYIDAFFAGMKNLTLLRACLGREDKMIDFYRGSINYGEGGTIIEKKQTGGVNYDKPIKVECINFARWFRENINEGDYVVLKMNIEGGEYDLMELLLDEDLTGMINKAYIHLHSHKFPLGEQRDRFNRIEARFWKEAKCIKYMSNKEQYRFE